MGRQSNASERRDQIIWALYDCLVEKGHEKVTIKEIAKKAGLPSGVIHYYFKSKDEIVSKLAAAIIEKYTYEIQDLLKDATSSEQKIMLTIDFVIDRLIFNLPLNRVFFNLIQMAFERTALNSVVKDMFENYRKQLSEIFQAAGAGDKSQMLGASLVAVTEGFSLQFMVDPQAFDHDDVREIITKEIHDRLDLKKTD